MFQLQAPNGAGLFTKGRVIIVKNIRKIEFYILESLNYKKMTTELKLISQLEKCPLVKMVTLLESIKVDDCAKTAVTGLIHLKLSKNARIPTA